MQVRPFTRVVAGRTSFGVKKGVMPWALAIASLDQADLEKRFDEAFGDFTAARIWLATVAA